MSAIIDLIVKASTSQSYMDIERYYSTPNIFEELKITRRETELHSAFLRWYLDSGSNHNIGKRPLQLFLQSLSIAMQQEENKEARLDSDIRDAFLVGSYVIDDVVVDTERKTKEYVAQPDCRIDILAEVSITINDVRKVLPIVIENKVKSKEHSDQTITYEKWAEIRYSDKNKYHDVIYVFLKPTFLKKSAVNKNFINYSYQELTYNVIERSMVYDVSEFGRHFISQYLHCLSVSDIGQLNEENEIMAMTSEEKELLKKYYKEHESLILAVIEAYRADDDTTVEEKKVLADAVELLTTSSTRNQIFEFDGQKLKKRPMVLYVVKNYKDEQPGVTEDDLREKFPDSIRNSDHKNATGGVIKNYNDSNISKDRYFDPISLDDGTQIAVSNQWDADTMANFIKEAAKIPYIITLLD